MAELRKRFRMSAPEAASLEAERLVYDSGRLILLVGDDVVALYSASEIRFVRVRRMPRESDSVWGSYRLFAGRQLPSQTTAPNVLTCDHLMLTHPQAADLLEVHPSTVAHMRFKSPTPLR